MTNKVKKIHSTAKPTPARSYGGPATAGIEYDADRNTLILAPDPQSAKTPLRHSFPDTWAETFVLSGTTAATAANYGEFFTAPYGVTIVSVRARFSAAGGSGSTVDIKKAASGTSIASGTSVLTAPIATNGTPATNVSGTLSGTVANTQLNAGDSLGAVAAGTNTGLANLVVTVEMRRTPDVA